MNANWKSIDVHITDVDGIEHALGAGGESPDSTMTIEDLHAKAVALVNAIDGIRRHKAGEINQAALDQIIDAAS